MHACMAGPMIACWGIWQRMGQARSSLLNFKFLWSTHGCISAFCLSMHAAPLRASAAVLAQPNTMMDAAPAPPSAFRLCDYRLVRRRLLYGHLLDWMRCRSPCACNMNGQWFSGRHSVTGRRGSSDITPMPGNSYMPHASGAQSLQAWQVMLRPMVLTGSLAWNAMTVKR